MARESDSKSLVLVLNSGSSSLKFAVFRTGEQDMELVLSGTAERIGRQDGSLHIRSADGKQLVKRESTLESQPEALKTLADVIRDHLSSTPVAVGHRIVHGGPNLRNHQTITAQVLEQLRSAVHFAPLHIPQALPLIEAAKTIFPAAHQLACFDDAFHRTLPETSSRFPLPKRYFDAGIRRYGFHGLSYESLVHHFGTQLPSRAIFAHLGNGSSLCALRDGVSVDTTMGLTPTGGIPMATRSGDLDPGVLLYLVRAEKLKTEELETLLNHQSGLLALSAGESDVKALEQRARANDKLATFALETFAVAVRKAIGGYMALLGGIDLLVFTGGIGEHSEYVRSVSIRGLDNLGLSADKIQVVPAQEEQQMARHCRTLIEQD